MNKIMSLVFMAVFSLININKSEKIAGAFIDEPNYPNSCCVFVDNINDYDTYAEAYFANLKDNYSYNTNNSCSFIALEMLLNYYDNCYNESIVAEKYESHSCQICVNDGIPKFVDSPGSKVDTYGITFKEDGYESNISSFEYNSNIINTKNMFLHSRLICEALELNYCKNYTYGTSEKQLVDICDSYLSQILGKNNYSIESGSFYNPKIEEKKLMAERCISLLKQEKPVLLMLNLFGGHSVIAFKFDEVNKMVYFHSGYHNYMRICKLSIDDIIDEIFGYIHLEFNIPNVPDTNYYYMDEYVTKKLKFNSFNANIIHTHQYKYICNKEKHYCYCKCGANYIEDHEFKNIVFVRGAEYLKCLKCEALVALTGPIINFEDGELE